MCHNIPTKLLKGIYMSQKDLVSKGLPSKLIDNIAELGIRIKIARTRRKLTMEEMSSRMFISRKTLGRLEKGDPGVSLAVFASALWVLGLDDDLRLLADPLKDTFGIFQDRKNQPKRVGKTKQDTDLDF